MRLLDRLFIESFQRTYHMLPKRLYLRFKRMVDEPSERWQSLGTYQRNLKETPYQLILYMGQWHQRWTYIKGHYPEPHITALLNRQLTAGDIFIDVGANIGVHTLYAAARVGKSGQVIAIEPNPSSHQRLQENLALNDLDWVVTHNVGLGNQKGVALLNGCNDMGVGSTLRDDAAQDETCEIQIEVGDDLFQNIPPDAQGICKIDVEGFELQVLQGMQQFIQNHPNIAYIIEVTDAWLNDLGGSSEALFDILTMQGYSPYEITLEGYLNKLDKPIDKHQYDALFTYQKIN